jgi:hypothetical protein
VISVLFLGIQIERKTDDEFYLTQPHLINDILKKLRLDQASMIKRTPGSKVLLRYSKSKSFDQHFDYRKVIGKMSYLEKCTRPDISCALHQAAQFVNNTREEHGKAVKWIGRY